MNQEINSRKIKESDLFHPLKTYLNGQGYSVHAEVRNCDVVARKEDEIIIIELKTGISLNLLIQATERKEVCESVYIAVPVPIGREVPPNFKRVKKLLRRLEIGCILVDFLKTKTKIRVELHPSPYIPRQQHKKRQAILREIDGRYAEFNIGGEAVAKEKITAYKQEALRIAHELSINGPSSPAQLRGLGISEKAQIILSKNVYGWFERQQRGIYQLHAAGKKALSHYEYVIHSFS